MKASMGRVPLWPGCRDPELPGASSWESIEHIGPLARSVADCALVLSVIAGPDPRDRLSIPSDASDWQAALNAPVPEGLRVAYCEKWAGIPVDPEIARVTTEACAEFCRRIEAEMVVAHAPDFPLPLFRRIVAQDTDIEGLRSLYKEGGIQPTKSLAAVLSASSPNPPVVFERMRVVNAMAQFMEDFDLLVTPTTACLPFPINLDGPGSIDGISVADDAWTPAAYPMNLTGQPAISVPVGFSHSGLPIGMQIVGPHLGDSAVISAAATVPTPEGINADFSVLAGRNSAREMGFQK
jgi:aspartyl-tRNA(Asn)/glutamyl-tRNA(Gln) amidotransferase subunit A